MSTWKMVREDVGIRQRFYAPGESLCQRRIHDVLTPGQISPTAQAFSSITPWALLFPPSRFCFGIIEVLWQFAPFAHGWRTARNGSFQVHAFRLVRALGNVCLGSDT